MSDSNNERPPLGGTARDNAVAVIKGAVSAIPFAGGILAEIVGMVIPQQRIERLESYVRHLNERLQNIEESDLRRLLSQPEAVDLFEDGAYSSARALSDERREHIARVVADGLKGDDAARLEAKRMLNLLSELGDDQLLILLSHTHTYSRDEAFLEKHAAALSSVYAHLGSSQEELDKDVINRLARDQLTRLGLLRPRFAQPRKGQIPEFDFHTGTVKTQGLEVSPLGRLLLSRIGLLEPGQV